MGWKEQVKHRFDKRGMFCARLVEGIHVTSPLFISHYILALAFHALLLRQIPQYKGHLA